KACGLRGTGRGSSATARVKILRIRTFYILKSDESLCQLPRTFDPAGASDRLAALSPLLERVRLHARRGAAADFRDRGAGRVPLGAVRLVRHRPADGNRDHRA